MTQSAIPARVEWFRAMEIATALVAELRPFCVQIEIAGSLRRHVETVKDIELLCVPKLGEVPSLAQSDLFADKPATVRVDLLMRYLAAETARGRPWGLRPSKVGGTSFGEQNKLLTWQPSATDWKMPIDVFTATEANWGRDLWVRTGPRAWNIATAKRAAQLGLKFHAYGPAAFTAIRGDIPVTCATEADFARVLRLGIPTRPEHRTDDTARLLCNV